MQNTKIIKAHLLDATNLHYNAFGKVLRVFDSNGDGELIPINFVPMGKQFFLNSFPYSTVYAEISY